MPSYRQFAFITAFGALIMPPSSYAQATDENRIGAATFEWVLANCKLSNQKSVGASLMFAQMVINGSSVEEMSAAREQARERVKAYPSNDAACVDLVKKFGV
ncbi:hypothetical protein [Agrobacterium larrymoorei]|uniref:hypothetical protein n=1 Tax=Agrobacterium larrymoorei TaxID=160699 RepID=UPI00286A673F|nr:hypothetical protein [Agrobacterium larrymoorei]